MFCPFTWIPQASARARYVASGGLIVVRSDPKKILLDYVRHHFMKPEILALIKRNCTGEINPKFTWKIFSEIEIPLPSIDKQRHILNDIDEIKKRKEALIREMNQLDQKIDAKISGVVPKVIENYKDIKTMGAEFIGSARLKPKR